MELAPKQILCFMKQFLITALAMLAAQSTWAQMPTEPWHDALRRQRWSAWTQHSGPKPGFTQAQAAAFGPNISGGLRLSPMDFGVWTCVERTMGSAPLTLPGLKRRTEVTVQPVRWSVGLGWESQRMQVVSRAAWGPWTVTAQPTAGQWSASWRQLQTSGWTLVAHVRQDLGAKQTEWILGLEREHLALYASSLGRWRLVLERSGVRLAVGGGSALHSAVGFGLPAPERAP